MHWIFASLWGQNKRVNLISRKLWHRFSPEAEMDSRKIRYNQKKIMKLFKGDIIFKISKKGWQLILLECQSIKSWQSGLGFQNIPFSTYLFTLLARLLLKEPSSPKFDFIKAPRQPIWKLENPYHPFMMREIECEELRKA